MLKVGIIGCGYWGPKLVRNFVSCGDTEVVWACDRDLDRVTQIQKTFPQIKKTDDYRNILKDETIDAVAIATPVQTHYRLAKESLGYGKHVLVEKPLAARVTEGEELVQLASEKHLRLMCDHIFCYTNAVRKMKEIIVSGDLGALLYFDSVRINLGLFQQDVNVIWDLAPHDLSILDFLITMKPVSVSAQGISHAGNGLENIAYLTLRYNENFIAHCHLSWLSPVKIRKTIIGGSAKMLVWNDLDQAEKIRIYDKGIFIENVEHEERNKLLVSYRYGDMYAPQIEAQEALSIMVQEFADCIAEKRPALTDGLSALRILRILEAADKSIKSTGRTVDL